MNITPRLFLVFLLALAVPASGLAGDKIHWLTDLEEAKKTALSENKLILADFWAKWCQPCKRMNRKTWTNPAVIEQSSRLVCLKLDTETNHALAKQYHIRSIPAVLILDGYGTTLISMVGYKDAEQITAFMKALPESAASIHLAAGRLDADPENLELQVALAYHYRLAGFYQLSNETLTETAESLNAEAPPGLQEKIDTFTALNYMLLDESKKAWKLFTKCVEDYPESEFRPLQLFSLVKTSQELKKTREAQEYLEALRTEFPDDKHTAWAEELMSH